MKKSILTVSLIAALSGFTIATQAQYLLVWQDDFDQQPVGVNSTDATYGAVAYNFAGAGVGNPTVTITNANPPPSGNTNYAAFTFDTTPATTGGSDNFGLEINVLPTTGGNTDPNIQDYTLEFDIALPATSSSLEAIGGINGNLGLYGNSSGQYNGDGCETNFNDYGGPSGITSIFPEPGAGWVHDSMPMGSFATAGAALLNPTDSSFNFHIGFYMAGDSIANPNEEIDIANVQVLLNTNAPPPPPPIMNVIKTQPGLRWFAQDATAVYNEQGLYTIDQNQSFANPANSAQPVTYSVTFQDYNTAPNFTFQIQFIADNTAQSANSPYTVYFSPADFALSIVNQGTDFTASIDYKTNNPAGGTTGNLMFMTTATAQVGTWTLVFTNNPDGSADGGVIAPDGTAGTFTVSSNIVAYFVNPVTIYYGIVPENTAGFGQFIDTSRITTTNVGGQNINDNFATDASFDTSTWSTGYSYEANSVQLVTTDTPYWVTWTVPANGFGLETATNLTTPSAAWYSPGYYAGGTQPITTLMGGSLYWTLLNTADLPTVDGIPGDPVSKTAFFRLSKPGPSQ